MLAALAINAAHAEGRSLRGQTVRSVLDQYREAGLPLLYSSSLVSDELRVVAEPAATDPVDLLREILAPHGLQLQMDAGVLLVVRDSRRADEAGSDSVTGADETVTGPRIETITVSASRYEILRDVAPSQFSIDRRTIETMPDIGDDPLRVLQRLPGAAASGASAETFVRGGDRGEVGIMLNGLRLFDPFHVRDYQSIFSAIDSRAVQGVEVFMGGFPAPYGDRLSGMVLMESLEPAKERRTEIGLSVYNTSVLAAGSRGDDSWLVSARRGNLDLVLDPELGSPSYADVFAEYEWQLSDATRVAFNALVAWDRVEVVLEADPEELSRVSSDTDNAQLWTRIDNAWSERLSSTTVLAATSFDNSRNGELNDEEKVVATVLDNRRVREFAFRQDFQFRQSDRRLVQWGVQFRQSSAEYLYRNMASYGGLSALFPGRDEPSALDIAVQPDGASYALYYSDRLRVGRRTSVEWGLRWDDQTFTDVASDSQLSPRLSFVHGFGAETELRLSWGRYHQVQGIHELQVEDGITRFWPAQQADHLIAGLRHRFSDRHSMRVELFDKTIRDVRPRFENLYDPLALIPEVEADRVRLDPSRANARGIEMSFDYLSGPWNWWATYVLSRAEDRIDGRDEPRSWNQRHAFMGGFSFSTDRWDIGLVANVHSGWPLTELQLVDEGFDEDGEPLLVATPGPRNAGNHRTFASLDVRVARKWRLPRATVSAFLEVTNLTNRRNPCCLDWDFVEDGPATGTPELERGVDYWMPLLPAVGVLIEF
ncbi:MAG: TonB-dependent receptor [Pseudomonadota bacterium]